LVILSSEELIDPITRSGYQVKSISINDLLEMLGLRSVLKVEAVGLAARRITVGDIHLLEENNLQEEEIALNPNSHVSAQSYRKGNDLNFEIHLTVARVSNNNRPIELGEKLRNKSERVLAYDRYFADSPACRIP
jgi:DNA-binding GntR family transcriptional regulator